MVLPSYNCVLCHSVTEETLVHLFIDGPFAQACWNLFHLVISPVEPLDVLVFFKHQLNVPFAMDVIIIMSWSIWMERNDLIFKNDPPILISVKQCFKAGYPHSKDTFTTFNGYTCTICILILLLIFFHSFIVS
jgi:hypothetical protein